MNTKEIDERFDNQFRYCFYSDETAEVIKSFLHTELSTLRSDLLKEIKEKMPDEELFANCEDDANFNSGWNSYRNQVTSLINNLIEEK